MMNQRQKKKKKQIRFKIIFGSFIKCQTAVRPKKRQNSFENRIESVSEKVTTIRLRFSTEVERDKLFQF